jgi:hypothetical protein
MTASGGSSGLNRTFSSPALSKPVTCTPPSPPPPSHIAIATSCGASSDLKRTGYTCHIRIITSSSRTRTTGDGIFSP